MNSVDEIIEKIKKVAYRRVVIRPTNFQNENIDSLEKLWKIVDECKVSLRGWDFPYIYKKNKINGIDNIQSWCDFMEHLEYWKLFQSGQFVHIHSFREDSKEMIRIAKKKIIDMDGYDSDIECSGYTEICETLFNISEIFEFALRLSQKNIFNTSVQIKIEMFNVKNRILFMNKWEYPYFELCKANTDLKFDHTYLIKEIIENSKELSLSTSMWFFERYGWYAPDKILREIQNDLFSKNV
jgi:hypothetical protein